MKDEVPTADQDVRQGLLQLIDRCESSLSTPNRFWPIGGSKSAAVDGARGERAGDAPGPGDDDNVSNTNSTQLDGKKLEPDMHENCEVRTTDAKIFTSIMDV